MNNMRQVGLGILAALVSVAILLGSLTLAFMESSPRLSLSPGITWTPLTTNSQVLTRTPTASGTSTPTPEGSPTAAVSGTPIGGETSFGTPSPTVAGTPTPEGSPTPTAEGSSTAEGSPTAEGSSTASATPCYHPSDWIAITIQDGDTLENLAARYNTTTNLLTRYNCLYSKDLYPGTRMYVRSNPPTPTPYCIKITGWPVYIVQPGDTLTHIAQLTGTTAMQLYEANCLQSTTIYAGKSLFVPRLPATPTQSPVPTKKVTKTPRPPTSTPVPSDTSAPTPVPSDTPVPPPSNTPVPPPSITPAPPPTVIFTIQPNGGT
jgi:LysM repeat protein